MINGFKILALLTAAVTSSVSMSLPSPAKLETTMTGLVHEAVNEALAMRQLQTDIETYLADHTDEEQDWSVAVALPDTDLEISYGGEAQTAASSIKLFLVGAVMENWDSIDIDQDVLEHLVASSIIISDNEAATELVILLGDGDIARGKQVVNDFCKAHGYNDTYLGIIFYGLDDTGTYNATTSKDMVAYLSDLLDGRLTGSREILEYMAQSERTAKIPASLPEGTKTANKTGELEHTENDACIVYGPSHTYTISIMGDNIAPEDAVKRIQEISKLAYDRLEKSE